MVNGMEMRLLTGNLGRHQLMLLFLSLLIAPVTVPVYAADDWKIERLNTPATPGRPVPETRQSAPNGLPDGLVATFNNGNINAAWYGNPTTRYGHAILGDGIEAGSLVVSTQNGKTVELILPQSEVFEDRYPRLADLDGDGSVEVITIRSSLSAGASVTIYGLENGGLVEQASTDFIGRANRWLNIAGIADFDGKPGQEIAYVRTPHIGGTLFFYSYRDGALSQAGAVEGFSNHAIGSREMRLSAIADVNGDGQDDLALPSDDRRSLRIVGFDGSAPTVIAEVRLPARIDKAIATEGGGREAAFIVGLGNQSTMRISR